jgi:hypothetical protein
LYLKIQGEELGEPLNQGDKKSQSPAPAGLKRKGSRERK